MPKRIPFNDLSRTSFDEAGPLLGAVEEILESGSYILGKNVTQFESCFSEYLGTQHSVGVGNGTDAIRIALLAVGVRPGDHVVTVANAGGYSSSAIRQLGAVPRYVDIDPRTLNMSSESLRESFEMLGRPRAVVVTHLYGNPAEVATIASICEKADVELVEDCAQAAGTRLGDKFVGTFGNAAAFSFFPTKNLGAAGDAGAVCTNDSSTASRAKQYRQYGWTEKYFVDVPGGMNSRMDEIQAAILTYRLASLEAANQRRVELIDRYQEALNSNSCHIVYSTGGNGHLAVMVCEDRELVRKSFERHGIETSIHYPHADYTQPGLRQHVRLVNTDDACARVVSIPNFPTLKPQEVDRILECLVSLT